MLPHFGKIDLLELLILFLALWLLFKPLELVRLSLEGRVCALEHLEASINEILSEFLLELSFEVWLLAYAG